MNFGAQNAVWFFFKKYRSKKLKDNLVDDNLQLANHAIYMFVCLINA